MRVTSPTRTQPDRRRRRSVALRQRDRRVAVGEVFGFGRPRAWPRTCAQIDGRTRLILDGPFGGGVIGNTTGSGPVVGGSSPPPRAHRCIAIGVSAPSSSGLGRRPLKAETAVRICSGLPHATRSADPVATGSLVSLAVRRALIGASSADFAVDRATCARVDATNVGDGACTRRARVGSTRDRRRRRAACRTASCIEYARTCVRHFARCDVVNVHARSSTSRLHRLPSSSMRHARGASVNGFDSVSRRPKCLTLAHRCVRLPQNPHTSRRHSVNKAELVERSPSGAGLSKADAEKALERVHHVRAERGREKATRSHFRASVRSRADRNARAHGTQPADR